MKTIYKYPLALSSLVLLDIHKGAEIISVAEQHGVLCMWALVDTEAPMTKRQIRVVGTGQDAADVRKENYVGSVLVLNGTYVWHIFDMGEFLQ